MKLNWNFMWLTALATTALFGAGCGGINANQSVSPASFFLPGLMKNDAPTNTPVASLENFKEFALVKN